VAIALHLAQGMNYFDLKHGSFSRHCASDSATTRKTGPNQELALLKGLQKHLMESNIIKME